MAADYDATEFIDNDFQATHKNPFAPVNRAPTREEVDAQLSTTQREISELRRQLEEKERERAGKEELRRRQIEFQTGRQETIQNLTRGVGLLEEAEFSARRDAEHMARALADMREALTKVESIKEEAWTDENLSVELTRALTAIENARMEWNAARVKFPVLGGVSKDAEGESEADKAAASPFSGRSFLEYCKLGFLLTWPLAIVALAGFGVVVAMLLRRH